MTDPIRDYLDQAQARANAATEGTWHRCTVHFRDKLSTSVKDESAKVIAHTGYPEDINDDPAKNAAFIAHAREDVPRLVAALTAVLDLCDDYERVFDVMGGDMAASEAHVAGRIREVVTEALGVGS